MKRIKALFTHDVHFNVLYGTLWVAVATLPFTTRLMLPAALVLILNWIIEWNWKEKWANLRDNKALPILICSTLLYLMLIPGWFISCNKADALAAFDCCFWLPVASLVVLTSNIQLFTQQRVHVLFRIFTLGIVVHLLLLLCLATIRSLQTGDTSLFYYSAFSRFTHPSYLAMYATFAFFFLLQELQSCRNTLSTLARILHIAMMILLFTGIFLLQSKAGLITFFLLSLIWITLYFVKRKRIVTGLLVLVVLVGGSLLLLQADWIQKNRMKETMEQIRNRKDNPYGTDSSEMRITLWKAASEVIQKNLPWGVGTGDADQELHLHALHKNYTNVIRHHYNAHNQYLQTLLETGILGLLALLALCLYPLYYGIRHRDTLYVTFAIIVLLNISVECMLRVRAGVNFIALFNVLLFINIRSRETLRSDNSPSIIP